MTSDVLSAKGINVSTEVKKAVAARGIKVESGVFQAHMLVEIANDGPVTLILEKESGSGDSRNG